MAESLMKELPVHNRENFSKFQADSHKRVSSKKPPVYIPTTDDYPSTEIVTEKTNILLRYLHQTWERKVGSKCRRSKQSESETRHKKTHSKSKQQKTKQDHLPECPRRKRDLHESRGGSTEEYDNSGASSQSSSSGQTHQSGTTTAPPRTKRPRHDNGASAASNSNDST